jgi:hypothetical protein
MMEDRIVRPFVSKMALTLRLTSLCCDGARNASGPLVALGRSGCTSAVPMQRGDAACALPSLGFGEEQDEPEFGIAPMGW